MKRIGIYPGTFDPITKGHADILIGSQRIVDELIIAVAVAVGKKPIFTVDERCVMVEEMIEFFTKKYRLNNNIKVLKFDGLLVDFARTVKADLIIRGLRAVSDFEYEFQMSCMNARLEANIGTIFLPASEKNQFISSRLVKEIAALGGDISQFVIPAIADKVAEYYKNN